MTDYLLTVTSKNLQSDFMNKILPQADISVIAVVDYEHAVESVKKYLPDLVLVFMPPEPDDGPAICSGIRRTTTIPIVLWGHESAQSLWANCLESGADFYLVASWADSVKAAMLKSVIRRYRWNQGR
jgi:DNA-binding response OmpR family regulator